MEKSKEVFLMTVGEDMKVEIIEAELKKAGIPLLKKHREGGDYLSIYMGRSMYGVDLYVSEESYGIAREILLDLGITDIEGNPVGERNPEKDGKGHQQNKVQVKMFKVGIFLIFLLWLLLWWRSA
ncbi:putative signal transducing protein [Isachenkonia alkalipeptolytica]|uniref:DUF2007 domain-containing protein n=1 Tax=Isachenkonia alkalipeptolytica TaxID=2565777 RepID=A0AA43XMN3_9CLOT|nr:DUF2007 domain-containing protein [Isachenkonia alkalipeptolytica]NBG89643.1 hypothetical protein [Isachenkonia alkalipeptolytica]